MKLICSLLMLWFGAAAPAQALDACDPQIIKDYVPFADRAATPALLFKLSACHRPPSYLFGTVHSDDPALKTIAAPVMAAIDEADEAAFEFIEPADPAAITRRYMFLDPRLHPDGLKPMLSDAELSAYLAVMRDTVGFPPEAALRLKPWAAAVLLQYPRDMADGVILDKRLQDHAVKTQTATIGLETMQEQLSLFDRIPEDQQRHMLADTLADLDNVEAMNDELLAAYKNQRLDEIYRLGSESIAAITDPKLREFMNEDLLAARNRRMLAELLPRMEKQSEVVAVGAMHLAGKDGLIALMEREGYVVEPIAAK